MHFSKKIKGLYIIIVTSTTIKSFQGEKQKKKKKEKQKQKMCIYIYVNVFFKRKNHKLQRSFFFNNY